MVYSAENSLKVVGDASAAVPVCVICSEATVQSEAVQYDRL